MLNDRRLSRSLWKYVCVKLTRWSLICASKFKFVCNRSTVVRYRQHCGYDIAGQLCVRGSWLWYCWSVMCERIMAVILLVSYVWEDHGCDIAGQLLVRGSWLWYCWSVACERIMAVILLVSYVWEDHGCDIAGQLLVRGGWGHQCCWWELLVKEWPLHLYFWSDFSCEVIVVISLKDSYWWSELLVNKGLAWVSVGILLPAARVPVYWCVLWPCMCLCVSVFCLHPCTCVINSFRLMQHFVWIVLSVLGWVGGCFSSRFLSTCGCVSFIVVGHATIGLLFNSQGICMFSLPALCIYTH